MPRGTVEAARSLLEVFQNLANPDETGAKQVEIREFLHGSGKTHVRGVGAITKIPKGAAVLKIPGEYVIAANDIKGDRFESGPHSPGKIDGKTKLGLWLAEKKSEWLEHPAHKLTPRERYWRDAINVYPTLDDYESRGIPLAASEEDLNRISSLPAIGHAGSWASGARGRLAMAQATYNSAVQKAPADGHAALNWEDALWGRILSLTGSFGVGADCGGGMVAPVADLVNHSANHNAIFDCDPASGELKITSIRDIQPGEEVTISYKSSSAPLFQFYGIVEHAGAPEKLSDADCAALGDAHLEQGTSPLLKTAERFAEIHCPSPQPEADVEPKHDPQAVSDAPVASQPALQASVATPLPKIAGAALSPLVALLQPLMLFPKRERWETGVRQRRRSSQACRPAGMTDFI